jgi:uncharacterized membrane protein
MKTTVSLIGAATFGAGLMYVLDPAFGKRRRALIKDVATHGAKVLARGVDITGRDTAHRLKGVLQETKDVFNRESVPDEILTDRVRAEVGRVSSHPNVEAIVESGCVMLLGPVVAWEEDRILKAVRSVHGVMGIINRMEPYQPRKNMPTQASRERQLDIFQSHWAPATRVGAGAVGASLAAAAIAGMKNGKVPGALAGVAGLALVARAITNMEFKRLIGLNVGPHAVDIQKTIRIAAPIERVYSLFSDYKNFPLFMSRVEDVRDLGNGRSHWVLKGPLGTRLKWHAVVTQKIPNRLLAWKTEPGSLIKHAGVIHFDEEDGHTRVQVHLSYNPPAGALGHFIATLIGANPKQEMDQDLVRMQSFIQTGKRPHDASRRVA